QTRVDGVMSAEGMLHNPALFARWPRTPTTVCVWEATHQYIQLVRKYPCPFSFVRGHVFKLLHHCLANPEHEWLRQIVAKTHSLDDLFDVADQLKRYYEQEYDYFRGNLQSHIEWGVADDQNIPPRPEHYQIFFCKPYFRPPPSPVAVTTIEADADD